VLTYEEHADRYAGVDRVAVCGSLRDLSTTAHRLYDALRSFDEAGIEYIVAEGCPTEGVGEAIMNRLMKAAAYRIERIDG
jgi:SUA5 domain.